ncbi:hypothetical protein [Breznakia blatticola]|nr:hypothetical protein [Breznakia blatticola]
MDGLIIAIVSAVLTWFVTKLIDGNNKRLDMSWLIYEDLLNNLYRARELEKRYVYELSKQLENFDQVDYSSDTIIVRFDFEVLSDILMEFMRCRNKFLSHSRIFQKKVSTSRKEKVAKWMNIETNVQKFTNCLIEYNDYFEHDFQYMNEFYVKLNAVRSEIKYEKSVYPGQIGENVDSIIKEFHSINLKVTHSPEEGIVDYISNVFKKVV